MFWKERLTGGVGKEWSPCSTFALVFNGVPAQKRSKQIIIIMC